MQHSVLRLGIALGIWLLLAGCVVNETRPLPKLEPIQAREQIPEAELLDIAIANFEPNIPVELANDEEALDKRRIYPEVRNAESRLLADRLRQTLESSGQWGAVRVVPEGVKFVDVMISGKIIESTGQKLVLAVTAADGTGRRWFTDKTYSGQADLGSYRTEAALRARDPFQNVYVQIANDLLAARTRLNSAQRREIREVTRLEFAADLDPRSFSDFVARQTDGTKRLLRLPAIDDPALNRIDRIRERDAAVIDTLDGYTQEFSEKMFESYGAFRRTSREAIEREDRARAQAIARTTLGAAAVLASILVNNQCSPGDYNCELLDSAVRTAGAIGGTAAVLSGIRKFSDAKVAAQEVKELADSFEREAEAQVVEVEGRTLKLVGTAEEQYREWRRLLAALYIEESGPGLSPAP